MLPGRQRKLFSTLLWSLQLFDINGDAVSSGGPSADHPLVSSTAWSARAKKRFTLIRRAHRPSTGGDTNLVDVNHRSSDSLFHPSFDDHFHHDAGAHQRKERSSWALPDGRHLNRPDSSSLVDQASSTKAQPNNESADPSATEEESSAIKLLVATKKDTKNMQQAIGLVTLGFTVSLSIGVFLMNSSSKSLQAETWWLLNESVGIFIALQLFFAIQDIIIAFFTGQDGIKDLGKNGEALDQWFLTFWWVEGWALYLGLSRMVWLLRYRETILLPCSAILGHYLGFELSFTAYYTQISWPFNIFYFTRVWTIPVVTLWLIPQKTLVQTRRHATVQRMLEEHEAEHGEPMPTVDKEALVRWEHHANHTSEEYLSITLGLVFSQFCRYILTGILPPPYGFSSKEKGTFYKSEDAWLLLTATSFIALLAVLVDFLKARSQNFSVKQGLTTFQHSLVKCMAWNLYFAYKWLFDIGMYDSSLYPGHDVVYRLYMALLCTPVSLVLIVIFHRLASAYSVFKCLRILDDGWVVLIALSWEKCFKEAIKGGTSSEMETPLGAASFRGAVTLAVLVFVAPSWARYIQPKAMKLHNEMHKEEHGDHGDDHGHDSHCDLADAVEPVPLQAAEPVPSAAAAEPTAPVVEPESSLTGDGVATDNGDKPAEAGVADAAPGPSFASSIPGAGYAASGYASVAGYASSGYASLVGFRGNAAAGSEGGSG